MVDGEQPSFGTPEALRILNAGWRQGSPFRAPAGMAVRAVFDAESEWLVVCTQSCTIVSSRLDVDPDVEVAVARPLAGFNPKSQESRGKNFRRFHLPISGVAGVEALECDINRRFAIPRTELLRLVPQAAVTVSAARNLAGWISRYYTRVALPNELVDRAKASGLFELIKKALEQMVDRVPLHSLVDGIYVQWKPDEELEPLPATASLPYELSMLFLCTTTDADRKLGSLLSTQLEPFTNESGHNGICLMWDVKLTSSTFVSELDAYNRLSEWDYLSNLGDVAESLDRLAR